MIGRASTVDFKFYSPYTLAIKKYKKPLEQYYVTKKII